jgi:hypothetical protein
LEVTATSEIVSEEVCSTEGHHIQLFISPGRAEVYICIKCGLTLDEIRDKKGALRPA